MQGKKQLIQDDAVGGFNHTKCLLGTLRVLMQKVTSIKHKASSWNGNKQLVIIIYKIKAMVLKCAKYTLVA